MFSVITNYFTTLVFQILEQRVRVVCALWLTIIFFFSPRLLYSGVGNLQIFILDHRFIRPSDYQLTIDMYKIYSFNLNHLPEAPYRQEGNPHNSFSSSP